MLSNLPPEIFHYHILPALLPEEAILCRIAIDRLSALTEDEFLQISLYAAREGHLHVLKWITTEVDALEWLKTTNPPWSRRICLAAAGGGHLNVLKWLRANNLPWDTEASIGAALYGHQEVLKWLRANGYRLISGTCRSAISGGHLESLKWLMGYSMGIKPHELCSLEENLRHSPFKDNGQSWDEYACEYAAKNGRLEVLKWLRANQCPWDEYTCASAAGSGHLELLKWARDNGAPWDEYTCSEALRGGHKNILNWLSIYGTPCGAFSFYRPLDDAV